MSEARVVRIPADGETVTMGNGRVEPAFEADVYDTHGQCIATLHNSSFLCLGKGRSKRASKATDAEMLEAVLGDQSVFD